MATKYASFAHSILHDGILQRTSLILQELNGQCADASPEVYTRSTAMPFMPTVGAPIHQQAKREMKGTKLYYTHAVW